MNILGWEFSRSKNKTNTEQREQSLTEYLAAIGLDYPIFNMSFNDSTSMKLSTCYRCVSVISDSLAAMPFEPYTLKGDTFLVDRSHYSYIMLNVEPNPQYSRFTFFKQLAVNMLLWGNAYAIITRDNQGNPIRLTLIHPASVQMLRSTTTDEIKYMVTGVSDPNIPEGFIDSSNMIHILNHSLDGRIGISTIAYAVHALGLANAADATAKGFYQAGSNLSGIISVEGRLTPEKAQAIKDAWTKAHSPFESTTTAGGISVMEKGTTYTPISIPPAESQLLEAREFSVVEICRFFGVSPTKAFDLKFSSYNNVNSYQLSFITDTLQPIITKVENEFNRKLYRPSERVMTQSKFNIESLLHLDLDSKANYYAKMFQLGAYSVNEIRRLVGNEQVINGSEPMVTNNTMPLSKLYTMPVTKPTIQNNAK